MTGRTVGLQNDSTLVKASLLYVIFGDEPLEESSRRPDRLI